MSSDTSTGYRCSRITRRAGIESKKFLGRHRVQATAAAVVGLSLVTATTVAVRQATVASQERDRAEQALGQSKEVTDFSLGCFGRPRRPAPRASR